MSFERFIIKNRVADVIMATKAHIQLIKTIIITLAIAPVSDKVQWLNPKVGLKLGFLEMLSKK
jgi:hypothetical protein